MATQSQKTDIPFLKSIEYRDFSLSVQRKIQNSKALAGSVRMALNMDSTVETGSLVSRLGTGIVGTQQQSSKPCLGLGNFRDSVGTSNKLFAVFSNGTTNTVHDVIDGTKDLTGDTKDLATRFCTYLDSIVRVNGVDAVKSFNGTSWVTTGGAFDEANMPLGNLVIEWKDRIYTAAVSTTPDTLYFSSVANPSTRKVSWTVGNGFIMVSQEDGGGGIRALEKVPGYLLIFKERTMKRWDGTSTYPEDLIDQGAPTQEAVCRSKEICYFINYKGIWVTNGGYPVRISRPVQDLIDAIPTANLSKLCCRGDDEFVYFYIGTVTVKNDTFTNIVLKYNIEEQNFDVYSYGNNFQQLIKYVDSNGTQLVVGGDDNGNVIQINTGYTDYATTPTPITWTVETHQMDWGLRDRIKEIMRLITFSENISTGVALFRANSSNGYDYKNIGKIRTETEELKDFPLKIRGNYFNLKFTGVTSTVQVKFMGFKFPDNSIILSQNTKE